MEYIQNKPDNLNMYIDEFHTSIKVEFEKSINKMYNEEISVYKDVIETLVKLPFIQGIINENKNLKARIIELEDGITGVKLEITDKPVSTREVGLKIDRAWHSIQTHCLKLQIEGKIDGFKVGNMNLWVKKRENN